MNSPSPSIHREVLLPIALVFVGAVLFAVLAVAVILPLATTPAQAFVPIAAIVLADLAVLYLFLRSLLRRTLLEPLGEIEAHAGQIAAGDLDHRIPSVGTRELDGIVASVNTLAERLIHEKTLLAQNVASLEETNAALSDTSQELVRAARMASVGTLAAGVAHEIGNPLGAARAYLDVLESRAASGRPVGDLVGDLKVEMARIDEIVRAILAFSRPLSDERSSATRSAAPGGWAAPPEVRGGDGVGPRLDGVSDGGPGGAAGGAAARHTDPGTPPGSGCAGDPARALKRDPALPPAFSDYARVVEQVRLDLERAGRLDGVALFAALDADAPAVHAHPQHLERILSNLARNAAQALASAGGGNLRIHVTSVEAVTPLIRPRREGDPPSVNYAHRRRLQSLLQVQGAPPPNRGARDLLVLVEDDGPGIPEAVLVDIFDPFFTTREPGQGMGLGLALTARIVGELGGAVEAENRAEGGARFRVRIPGAASDPEKAGPATGSDAPVGGPDETG